MHAHPQSQRAFTLVELSIVLVIIGLIIGGVLVGQDLVQSAQTRAEIAQIGRYNAAVKTFYDKFQAIPGDMPVVTAQQYGFTVGTGCAGAQGARDGNGLLDGSAGSNVFEQATGEVALFWQDVSSNAAGNLIEGVFPNNGGAAITCSSATALSGTTLSEYFPPAKIGQGNFVYVYESSGYNWYGLSAITSTTTGGVLSSNATIPVIQAYAIDRKMDDALPTTGNVVAVYINGSATSTSNAANNVSDTTTTCYNTTAPGYSLGSTAKYGVNANCALSFRFP